MLIDGVFRIRAESIRLAYDNEVLSLESNFKIYETYERNRSKNSFPSFHNFNVKRK